MIYEELVEEIRGIFEKADVSQVKEHIAYQFNIEGEAEGAFYVEVAEGTLKIEPYEYFDRDVLFTTSANTLLEIAKGKLDAVVAFTVGKLKVEGDFDKALLLQQFSKEQKKADKQQNNPVQMTLDIAQQDKTNQTQPEKKVVQNKKTNKKSGKKSGR